LYFLTGVLAADRLLQVFDIASGQIVSRFWPLAASTPGSSSSADQTTETAVTVVRLTYDGRYVVWAEQMTIIVGRVCDGFVVASVSAHERVTSLNTTDLGLTGTLRIFYRNQYYRPILPGHPPWTVGRHKEYLRKFGRKQAHRAMHYIAPLVLQCKLVSG